MAWAGPFTGSRTIYNKSSGTSLGSYSITWYDFGPSDSNLTFSLGMTWDYHEYNTYITIAPKICRWDSMGTNNTGGTFDETLNPDANNSMSSKTWTGLSWASGGSVSGWSGWYDTFATRTYQKQSNSYQIALTIKSYNLYTYESGSYGNDTSTYYLTVPALPASNTYTIIYDDNGGSGGPGSQTKTEGTNLTISSTVPTREGYNFIGWSYAKSAPFADLQPGGTITQNEGYTLYAVWEQGCPHSNISALTNISWCLGEKNYDCCDGEEQSIYICKDCGKIKITSATVCSECCGIIEQSIWDNYLNKWINPTILLPWHIIIKDSKYTAQYPYEALNYYSWQNKTGNYVPKNWIEKIYRRIDKYFGYDILYEDDYGKWPYSGVNTDPYPVNLKKCAFDYQKLIIEFVDSDNMYTTAELLFPRAGMAADIQTIVVVSNGNGYLHMGGIIISEDGMQIKKNGYLGRRLITNTTSEYLWGYFFKITRVIGIKHI